MQRLTCRTLGVWAAIAAFLLGSIAASAQAQASVGVMSAGEAAWPCLDSVLDRAGMAYLTACGAAGGEENVPEFTGTPRFCDVGAEHWALDYVEYAVAQNVVVGYSGNSYRPRGAVYRAQMAVFVARAMVAPAGDAGLAGYTPPADPTFDDVPSTHFAYKYVEYLNANGIETACSSEPLLFCPGDLMTAYDAASWVYQALGSIGDPCGIYPTAEFEALPGTGLLPLTVTFTDLSANSPTSWDWDFGGGGGSTAQNPSHEHLISGSYTVSLTATDLGGSDTKTEPAYITVELVPPAADFSASPTSGTAPLTVDFTDLSSGEVTSWSWEFGDTTSSAEQDPSHQYTEAGSYTVSLTAANAAGSDTETKASYIAVMFPDAGLEHWACEEILACVDAAIVSGHEDGLYHCDWPVTRDQMAVYIARALVAPSGEAALAGYVPAQPRNFSDVPDTGYGDDGTEPFWAYTHIEYCVENGVVGGYGDGTYHPDEEVTRAQMAVYAARAMVAPTGEAALADYVPADPRNFPDVPDTGYGDDGTEPYWAYTHIEYCVENGVVQGYQDGLYHPDEVVTRAQMAVYVARIIWSVSTHLGLYLERSAAGLRVASLVDVATGRELAAAEAVPLFEITLRDGQSGAEALLTADAGWQEVTVTESARELLLGWASPEDTRLQGVSVTGRATLDPSRSAWHWGLEVDCAGSPWAVRHVVFPQLAVAELGCESTLFYASGPGIEKKGVWQEPFTFRGFYPGWDVSMQFLAAYDQEEVPSGLYFGMHDPDGCAKDVVVESQGDGQGVRLAFEQVAPNLREPGNGFVLPGEAVWQLFRGDWFDAALIYRDWVRAEAAWWPTLAAGGREDTALAMRELPVWTLGCCDPEGVASPAERFQEYLGVPVGMHWYDWHEIPFDNDYPHYFPAKPGVAEATRELQAANVMVMPYINARLWDTRDRGTEDWQFTATALPWATKDEQGNPVLESYGSTESDGSPVQLAVMCPATALWQETVNDICQQLFQEVGVDGVYLDQVAAARPVPCMAENHGHLPGGGSWWNEGYWQMLAAIRAAMPEGAFLTSEANAEVYAKWLDGFLVWHWQSDGMVPAFPAVYGGAVQMFGRSYWGEDGAVGEEALCAKAGQQLVFGEQLGWIYPWVVDRPSADFFRNLVQTRWLLRLYFYAGEMARPPRLEGEMPVVVSDWYWYGENWVTTDAVLTGAWHIPAERRLALFFVNVSDQPVTLTHRLNQDTYGISAAEVSRLTVVNGVPSGTQQLTLPLVEELHFAPRQVTAWELQW